VTANPNHPPLCLQSRVFSKFPTPPAFKTGNLPEITVSRELEVSAELYGQMVARTPLSVSELAVTRSPTLISSCYQGFGDLFCPFRLAALVTAASHTPPWPV
jgi:hypothetical protein